jgi:hypothetical protein
MMDQAFPAIVAYVPTTPHTPNWKYQDIKLARRLESQELLVRVVATGYVSPAALFIIRFRGIRVS